MCKYCDLKKSERYGGIYRGETMAYREFFEACQDVPTKDISIFIAENDMCSSGLGLYLDEGSMANVIGLKHIDSISINFCFHCGKSSEEILKQIEKSKNSDTKMHERKPHKTWFKFMWESLSKMVQRSRDEFDKNS